MVRITHGISLCVAQTNSRRWVHRWMYYLPRTRQPLVITGVGTTRKGKKMKEILLAMAMLLLVSIIPAAAEPSDFSNSPQAVYMQSINQGMSSEVRATGNLVDRASKYLARSARDRKSVV